MDSYTPSGDGKTSPLGNGAGDAKSNPTGPGRDFIKENAQPGASSYGPNPQSIPAGGAIYKADPPSPRSGAGKPFSLKG